MASPSSPAPPHAAAEAHRMSPLRLSPKHARPLHHRFAVSVAASTRRADRRSRTTSPGRRGGAGSIWVNPSALPHPGAVSRTLRRLVEVDDLDAALRLLLGRPSTTSTPVASESAPEPPAVITCNILIKKLCAHRRLADAERVLEALKASGAADAVSHNTLVAGYCREGCLGDAERVLETARASGSANVVTYTALIDGYCRSGRLADALRLIASMPVAPDTYTYNTVLKGICGAKQWEEADELMAEMIRNNCHPNEGLCIAGRWGEVGELIADMVRKDCPPNDATFSTLINSLCQNRLVEYAIEVLEQMQKYGYMPDVVSYNTIVSCFSEQGRVDDALKLLNTMLCKPDTVSFNSVLKCLCRAERWCDAVKLMDKMLKEGCPIIEMTFNILIDSLCQNGLVNVAIEVFELMPEYRCTPDIVTYSSLINGFSEQGLDEVAFDLFRSMPCKADAFSYNAVLKGLCTAARWDDAGELIADMVTKGCLPNEVTFNTLINSLCQRGLVDRAIEVYEQMPNYGITPDVFTYNALINGFSEQGHLDDALKLLSSMSCEPDTISYNSILKGLCRVHRWNDADKLVTEMLRKNCTPNEVTFKYANQLFMSNRSG
ncbi:hypothetical protein BS78_K034000 [Paspalum vaginatum]|uniref:Pentatricopeptide repeat-containing protein n=1 Tax=Paspalum vaginatum TaxID=158149 RepID=A0A9W7XDQ2_9POAL|nr:hypothetical protein BS78_K034000 [Paspalum vaginatum]